MKYEQAFRIAEEIGAKLHPYVDKLRVAGSIRRKKAEPNDIEIVCIPKTRIIREGLFNDEKIIRHPNFGETIRQEYEILKGDPDKGKYIQCLHPEGIKIDIFLAVRENWGYIFSIRTGSSEFSKFLAARWVRWGYKGVEGHIVNVDTGERIVLKTEKAFFDLLGLKVVPPEKRNQDRLP